MIKYLIIFLSLFSISTLSGEVEILAMLRPAGTMEIFSNKILGQFVEYKDSLKAKRLYLDVKTLDSGVTLRNEHIHKFLINDKQKKVEFHNVVIHKKTFNGSGYLKIKGVKKEIKFKVKKKGSNLISNFNINMNDFKLPKPNFMGISVGPIINLKIKILPRDITKVEDL